MTVSNVSSSPSGAYHPPAQATGFINAIEHLARALQSGNQPAAQQAYGALGQSLGAKGGQNGPFAQALSRIGTALKSGNLEAAQQALASLTQPRGRAHHHPPGGDGKAAGATTGDPPSKATDGSVDVTA
jgi:hypothetical protein